MRTFIAATIAAIASATQMTSDDYTFIHWVAEHGKTYATVEEFNFRKETFMAAHQKITQFNSKL